MFMNLHKSVAPVCSLNTHGHPQCLSPLNHIDPRLLQNNHTSTHITLVGYDLILYLMLGVMGAH